MIFDDKRRSKLMSKTNAKGEIKKLDFNNKLPKMTFKKMGDWLITYQRPLTFQDYDLHTNSITRFLAKFMELNDTYVTIDAETGAGVCSKGKRRSLGDIFLITRSYFPKVGLRTIARALVNNHEISTNACSQILRRVYHIRPNGQVTHRETEHKDEFGYDLPSFTSFANDSE